MATPDRLHDLVAGLRDAERYERGRAAYPPELVALTAERLRLEAGAPVLDLGAGTGMLSAPFVAAGFAVTGVEPLPELRTALAGVLGPERSLDGTAEAIPLRDGAVAASVSGDAFHWFDGDAAAAELHRVLRPGGGVLLVWRIPRSRPDAPWMGAVERAMASVRPEHPGYTPDRGTGAFARHPGFTDPERVEVPFERVTDAQGVVDYVASTSYVGLLDAADRAALLARVRAALPQGELRIPHAAECWFSRRLP